MLKLYDYFRSSCAYRLRIALNLKAVEYQTIPIDLLQNEQQEETYLKVNPQGLVPALQIDETRVLTQSNAILEWLDESYKPALYADDITRRAKQRALCNMIACDIHPLNNLRVLKYLSSNLSISEEQKNDWYRHWVEQTFSVIEHKIEANPYACGSEPSMVDVYLVPQVFNALRFKCDTAKFPQIMSVYQHCNTQAEFIAAKPENVMPAV